MLQNILDNDILKSLYFTELKMLDLIVNPYAGRGRAKTDAKKVFEILDANNVKFAPHYTARKKHATEIAYNLTLSGAETIVSVGGDGTIHEIVNGIILARRELENKVNRSLPALLSYLPERATILCAQQTFRCLWKRRQTEFCRVPQNPSTPSKSTALTRYVLPVAASTWTL